ncbi:MAG: phenylalanine--tRNA ligase subunit beta [Planctomycetota bacterium]
MDTSLAWLNDYLDRPVTADEADHLLTRSGFPIEEHRDLPGGDSFLDVEVTSNRGDCLNHIGLARECAAGSGRTLVMPADPEHRVGAAIGGDLTLEIRDAETCPRFTARLIRGVKVGPSPDWLVQRLEAVGQRSINNVVDVTNFVMLETGHPCHVFDLGKLRGRSLIVRNARKGEKLTTLDGQARELHETDVVVADSEGATSLAGVIGGADSEVSDDTTTVVFEMATWHPVRVRTSGRRHKVSTDAAYRFERGVSPLGIDAAAERAVALIAALGGGEASADSLDAGGPPPERPVVELRTDRCSRMIGLEISTQEQAELLSKLEMDVSEVGEGTLRCTVPHFRGDLTREIDLIEEVARLKGLDAVPIMSKLPVTPHAPRPADRGEQELARALCGLGFYETVTFSFVSPEVGEQFLPNGARTVAVDDDRRKAEPTLRPSVLPGLMGCRKGNQDARSTDGGLRLFEFASAFAQTESGESTERRVAALLADVPGSGPKRSDDERAEGVRLMRGAIEAMVKAVGGTEAELAVEPAAAPHAGFDADVCGQFRLGPVVLGHFGLASSEALKRFDLEVPVVLAEVDLAPLRAMYPPRAITHALPAYPPADRDVSLVVDESVRYAEIESVVAASELEGLESVAFGGIYRGKQLGSGKKSVTIRLRFRDDSRTLRREEVEPRLGRLYEAAKAEIGAEVRA